MDDIKTTRIDMEQIYLYAFRINMLKDSDELVNGFLHIEEENDLALSIAEEYCTRDLLAMHDRYHPY